MSIRRMIGFSALLLGVLGPVALPGCGGGGGAGGSGPNAEVKIEPPVNPKPGAVPVQEEYKNMDPAGKAR